MADSLHKVNLQHDLELVKRIIESLEHLDPARRMRVLRAVAALVDGVPTPDDGDELRFSDRETITVKDFIEEKRPISRLEEVACLVVYAKHYLHRDPITWYELVKLAKDGGIEELSLHSLSSARVIGLVLGPYSEGDQEFVVAAERGERLVDALPDRDEVNAILEARDLTSH